MIRDFLQWTASFVEAGDLEELRNCRVGIEAAEYLSQRILNNDHAREPLLPALGGLPIALEHHIQEDLDDLRRSQIEPYFIFSGLDITRPANPFAQKAAEAAVNRNAWNLYDNHEAEASVGKFGESTYVTPEDLFRALQSILTKHKVRWMVAPYSAWAQLAYLENHEYVHAVFASSETLLFECSKIIISWELQATPRTFRFVRRERCIADLSKFTGGSNVTDDLFLDTCLLAGTPFLGTLPVLEAPMRADLLKPHAAIKIMTTTGQSGNSVVLSNQDHPSAGKEYVTRYQKARLAIKNHPTYTEAGNVEPQNSSSMPYNAVEYLSKRLPDEMLHYMSNGLVNPRILQWRTTCEVFEVPPMDGGESSEYKKLVGSTLIPLRTLSMNLLSSPLFNWYRYNDLKQTNWFSDPGQELTTITVERPTESQTPSIVDTWNVKQDTYKDVVAQYKQCGLLGSAILVLQNADFVSKSVAKKDPKNVLSSIPEILYNSIWRFLALRQYVDSSHNLTQWGKVLAAVITGLQGQPEREEAALLAVELIRMDLLTADINMFPTYNGAPMRGSTEDKNMNMLVSRVAGLGVLHHNPIGFTGPLSQHLLGYNSIINVVRHTLRDLVEVAATQMFLAGCCDRNADISSIAMKLPFLLPNNCALSIAVKSYLDDLMNDPDPTAAETKARVVAVAAARYFPQSVDYSRDLKIAFALWDAIYAGVKSEGTAIPDATRELWKETDTWLEARR